MDIFAFMMYPMTILLAFICFFQEMVKQDRLAEERCKKENRSYWGRNCTTPEEAFFFILGGFLLLSFSLAVNMYIRTGNN